MSITSVFAAAAALREFTVEELAAFCDEQPPAIVAILDSAHNRIERAGGATDPTASRWRVVDLEGLRRDLAARATKSRPDRDSTQPDRGLAGPDQDLVVPDRDWSEIRRSAASPATHLQVAERTLSECATEESATARRILVATAKNHLRHVLASVFPERRPWWSVDVSLQQLGETLRPDPDELAATRLGLNVALACLAEYDVAGHPVPTQDLVATIERFQRFTTVLENPLLHDLVCRFFDLVTAQLVPRDHRNVPAADRLIAAVARRRVRAQVEHGVEAAMHSLVPLLENLDVRRGPAQDQGLYQVLAHLPDGRDRVVVYTDLLQILPKQYLWHTAAELLPGALIEAVTDPEATTSLAYCAAALEQDLIRSPFGSEAALIGQVAHVFQDLATQIASLDSTVLDRSDRTRCELLRLAKAQVWRPCHPQGGSR